MLNDKSSLYLFLSLAKHSAVWSIKHIWYLEKSISNKHYKSIIEIFSQPPLMVQYPTMDQRVTDFQNLQVVSEVIVLIIHLIFLQTTTSKDFCKWALFFFFVGWKLIWLSSCGTLLKDMNKHPISSL